MILSVVSINIGKWNIFHRSDEAMLFVMMKAWLHFKIILSFRTFENFFLHLYGFKKNEKSSLTQKTHVTLCTCIYKPLNYNFAISSHLH